MLREEKGAATTLTSQELARVPSLTALLLAVTGICRPGPFHLQPGPWLPSQNTHDFNHRSSLDIFEL